MDIGAVAIFIEEWIGGNAPLIAAAGLGLAAVSLLVTAGVGLSARRARRRYELLMRGPNGADLDKILVEHARQLQASAGAIAALERRCEAMERAALRYVQHVGIVRFSAFAGTGADLSFAIALLDGQRNGFVLSSLYGRDDLRAYAKPVVDGRSSYTLTTEEEEAIRLALQDAPAAGGVRKARTG